MLGVATPSDLVKDETRTPFNIGEAIELQGFKLNEAKILMEGFKGKVSNPEAVLERILYWTSGQPFLTQKLCQFVLVRDYSQAIITSSENRILDRLVESQVIKDWQDQDNPAHLKTIRDRIMGSKNANRLLRLYQQILQQEEVTTDQSPEQMELLLSGLVVKKNNKLKPYNRIYQEVFNENWVKKQLVDLRPYSESITAWLASNRQDSSRLLRGKALQEAREWAENKSLNSEDYQFLDASQQIALQEEREAKLNAERQASEIFSNFIRIAEGFLGNTEGAQEIFQEVQSWTNNQGYLTLKLFDLVKENNNSSSEGTVAEWIKNLVYQQIVKNWETNEAAEHLETIRDYLLRDQPLIIPLLEIYQQILEQQEVTVDFSSEEQNVLLRSGLVVEEQKKLRVANRIYQHVFDLSWINKTLEEEKKKKALEEEQKRKALEKFKQKIKNITSVFAVPAVYLLGLAVIIETLHWATSFSQTLTFPTIPPLATTATADVSMTFLALALSFIVIFSVSKLGGELCAFVNLPPILGEVLGGVIIGVSALNLTTISFLQITMGLSSEAADSVFGAQSQILSYFTELGLMILLFEIGLEFDLKKLIRTGPQATIVAIVGVVVPFSTVTVGLIYLFGIPTIPSIFAGAALTGSSIGIAAKVLAELGRLSSKEGQIIIGAAVLTDILALILLSVVSVLAKTGEIEITNILYLIIKVGAFLLGAILIGRFLSPYFVALTSRMKTRGYLLLIALIFVFTLSYIAAVILGGALLGAFTAGLILAETEKRRELEEQIIPLADLFVPVLFVYVGAKTDFSVLYPWVSSNRESLIITFFLILTAIIGKVIAGLTVSGQTGVNRLAIGIGMIPRSEITLCFAGISILSGVLSKTLEAALIVIVMTTTFFVPPLLRLVFTDADEN